MYLCQLCSDDLDDATSSTFFFSGGNVFVLRRSYLLLLMVKSHKVTVVFQPIVGKVCFLKVKMRKI